MRVGIHLCEGAPRELVLGIGEAEPHRVILVPKVDRTRKRLHSTLGSRQVRTTHPKEECGPREDIAWRRFHCAREIGSAL